MSADISGISERDVSRDILVIPPKKFMTHLFLSKHSMESSSSLMISLSAGVSIS
jgi:hypothetical protein